MILYIVILFILLKLLICNGKPEKKNLELFEVYEIKKITKLEDYKEKNGISSIALSAMF